jgi:hypothetical protein
MFDDEPVSPTKLAIIITAVFIVASLILWLSPAGKEKVSERFHVQGKPCASYWLTDTVQQRQWLVVKTPDGPVIIPGSEELLFDTERR